MIQYCRAHTYRDRMMYYEDQIKQVLDAKQRFRREIGYYNRPLMAFDLRIAEIRNEQKRIHDLMTGQIEVTDAEYEILN